MNGPFLIYLGRDSKSKMNMDSINLNHRSKPMLYNLGLVFQIVNSPQQKKIHQTKVYSSPLCLVLTQAQIF